MAKNAPAFHTSLNVSQTMRRFGMRWKIFSVAFGLILLPVITQAQPFWQNIGPGGGSDLHVVKFQPDNEQVIYVGGDIEGLFKSTDGGHTWQSINHNLAEGPYGASVYWINDIVFDPSDYQTVYLCTGAGLFKGINGGQSWQELYVEVIEEEELASVTTVAIDPSNSDIIFMGLGDRAMGAFADFEPFVGYDGKTGLFKSTDGGQTWELLNVAMPDSTSINSIIIHNSTTIIISTTRGVYRSDDGGTTWMPKNIGLPHTNTHVMKKTYIGGQPVLYLTLKTLGDIGDASTFRGGIFRSDDLGDTWINITGNLPRYDAENGIFYEYWKFDIDPSNPKRILVANNRGSSWNSAGIYETIDATDVHPSWNYIYTPGGQGWMGDGWFEDPYAHDIAFASSNPAKVAYTNVWVSISNDGGYTYAQAYTSSTGSGWKGSGLELMNTDAIAFDPLNPDRIYIGYDDMGLFRSEDNANSFIRLDPAMDPVIGSVRGDGIKEIVVDPANGDLYISRWQGSQGGYSADYTEGGIVFSADQGTTQSDLTKGAFKGRCDIAVDVQAGAPGNRTVYAAVYHDGVYKRTNGSWQPINSGLGAEAANVWEIAIDPNHSQNLWLGLNHRGDGGPALYRSTDGGQSWTQVTTAPQGDILKIEITRSGKIYLSLTDIFDWPYDGGVYLSEDNGNTWREIFDTPYPLDFDVHPSKDQVIAVAASMSWKYDPSYQPGVYLTTDQGTNWQLISQNLNHTFINFVRFNPNNPNDLYVGTAGGGLWLTQDVLVGVQTGRSSVRVFQLLQNYPNPFWTTTHIVFELPREAQVYLQVYDLLGRTVKTLVNKMLAPGRYEVEWNGTDEAGRELSSGVYCYSLKIRGKGENFVVTRMGVLFRGGRPK